MLNMLNVLFGFGGAMNGRTSERDLVLLDDALYTFRR